MAKKIQKQNKIIQNNIIDEKIRKYFWLIIPILTIIYFISSRFSVGFYQDDEISQYINMIDFWVNPSVILGNAPKPGWKIFMVIPALVNYDFVLLFNSFIAAFTVFMTYKLLQIYGLKNAIIGALLLSVQPLYFDLSFRSYPEMFTALTFTFFLISIKKEKYFLSALIAGYIYTVRQEIAILLVMLFIYYLYKKKYVAILGLAIAPLFYNILGYLKTGDPIYVITEMFKVAGLEYRTQGPLHYFKFYIFIIGPISLTLFLNGFFSFLAMGRKYKTFLLENFWFYAIFLIVFISQILTTLGSGPNPGNWRYLLHLSPICIYFVVIGLNNIADKNFRAFSYIIPAILLFLTFAFLSKVSDGYVFKEPPQQDFTKAIFILTYFLIITIFSYKKDVNYLNKIAILFFIASILYLVIDFKPKQLSQENLTMQKSAEYISELNIPDSSKIFTNHFLTRFFYKNYKDNPLKFTPIWSKKYANIIKDTSIMFIEDAPQGSVIVWEPHYSYRIYNKDTVGIEEKIILADTTEFKLLQQIVSPDRKSFYSYIFQKK